MVKDSLKYEDQKLAMKEEHDQIEKNKIWSLVPRPKDKNVIRIKWVFRNLLNENGEVI